MNSSNDLRTASWELHPKCSLEDEKAIHKEASRIIETQVFPLLQMCGSHMCGVVFNPRSDATPWEGFANSPEMRLMVEESISVRKKVEHAVQSGVSALQGATSCEGDSGKTVPFPKMYEDLNLRRMILRDTVAMYGTLSLTQPITYDTMEDAAVDDLLATFHKRGYRMSPGLVSYLLVTRSSLMLTSTTADNAAGDDMLPLCWNVSAAEAKRSKRKPPGIIMRVAYDKDDGRKRRKVAEEEEEGEVGA